MTRLRSWCVHRDEPEGPSGSRLDDGRDLGKLRTIDDYQSVSQFVTSFGD